MGMDELANRRQARDDAERAWFMDHWHDLDADQRAAVAALIRDLHEHGLRRRPAAVAWLDDAFRTMEIS
jgi:hypothetical protein